MKFYEEKDPNTQHLKLLSRTANEEYRIKKHSEAELHNYADENKYTHKGVLSLSFRMTYPKLLM